MYLPAPLRTNLGREQSPRANALVVQGEKISERWPRDELERLTAQADEATLTSTRAMQRVDDIAGALGGLGVSVPRTRERV